MKNFSNGPGTFGGAPSCVCLFTNFDFEKAVEKFKRLAFEWSFEFSLSKSDYKAEIKKAVDVVEKFEGLVIEELHEEINAFVEIFNNAYEAWKWIQQYDKAIEEIKLSLLKLLKKSNYLPMRIEKN